MAGGPGDLPIRIAPASAVPQILAADAGASGLFYGAMAESILMLDLKLGLYKSVSFGLLVTWICCYKGFYAGVGGNFGAEGVSRATTDAVVLCSVLVLVLDYYITSVMLF